MLELSFILLGIVFFYGYIVYPSLLCILSKRNSRLQVEITEEAKIYPLVTFIVPVFNAEQYLVNKINNCLDICYPKDKLQFIFVSDASTDDTVKILTRFPEIEVVSLEKRSGKEKALQLGIAYAKGEVVCISDVSTYIDKSSIKRVVASFSDPLLGVVSSVDRLDSHALSLDSIHIRFEMLLRGLESKVSSCVGVSGSFFAARLSLCKSLKNENCCSDLEVVFSAVRKGFYVKQDPRLVGRYSKTYSSKYEFARQVRIITHGINTIVENSDILNPFKYGLFFWQVVSHKIIRWLIPMLVLFLGVVLVISWLVNDVVYLYFMLLFMFLITCFGLLTNKWQSKISVWRGLGMLFVYVFSVLFALISVIVGKKQQIWVPTKRQG